MTEVFRERGGGVPHPEPGVEDGGGRVSPKGGRGTPLPGGGVRANPPPPQGDHRP